MKRVAYLLFSSGTGPGNNLPQWVGKVQKGHQCCFTMREATGSLKQRELLCL